MPTAGLCQQEVVKELFFNTIWRVHTAALYGLIKKSKRFRIKKAALPLSLLSSLGYWSAGSSGPSNDKTLQLAYDSSHRTWLVKYCRRRWSIWYSAVLTEYGPAIMMGSGRKKRGKKKKKKKGAPYSLIHCWLRLSRRAICLTLAILRATGRTRKDSGNGYFFLSRNGILSETLLKRWITIFFFLQDVLDVLWPKRLGAFSMIYF